MANEMASKAATVNSKQPRPVDLIVTHIRPHFDEVLSIYLLKAYGEKFFPCISDAGVETWGEGKILKDYAGKTADELLTEQKMLCVGTCSGMFDEHAKNAPTCAHLVVEFLGIADKPELQKILQFCKRVDCDGHSMPFDLHSTMKDMYEFYGDNDNGMQTVFGWAMQAVQSHIGGQRQFHACADEFKRTGKIINGGPVRIALVESDNPKIFKWIRYACDSPEIIVRKNYSGNIIILTSPQKIFDMRDVVRIVREMELQKRKLAIPQWKILELEGTINECPWWYYYKNGEQLLNGTITSPDVEPTTLRLMDIARAIALACTPAIDPCKVKSCTKTCNKYQHGLITCRKKRFNERRDR